MGTTRSFSTMLNEYLPNELLKEEMIKRTYALTRIDKDDNWKGGDLIVPFKAAGASSVASGSLSASNDIAEDLYVRGKISGQVEIWGSMIFNQRDLYEHDKISEQNFLKILPDSVDDFMDYLKTVVSLNMLNSSWFDVTTAAATANDGKLVVSRPDRYSIGQKVIITATSPATITAYVKNINVNLYTITFVTARGGATVIDFSANNVASGAKLYNDGFQTSSFDSMKLCLLAATHGGSTTLYGQTKTDYAYLQAINMDGSAITKSNIVEKCFYGFTETRRIGKGRPTEILLSYRNLGFVMAVVEASKGAYNVVPNSMKAEQYGWTEIQIGSVTNQPLKFVGIQEMDDDVIMFIDWRGWKFYSNGFFKKNKSPDGNEFYVVRNTTGYQYIIDICLFGQLACQRPSYNGIFYGVSIAAEVVAS